MASTTETRPAVDFTLPVPRYYQIQLILQDRVESGEWAEGAPISSERDLCLEFAVSRPTIRQALANLVAAGFLRREQGKGTFVARPKLVEHTLTAAGRSTYQGWQRRGLDFTARLFSMKVDPPSASVRRKLQLADGDRIVRIERLLSVGPEVIRHVVSRIPYKFCPGILEEAITGRSLSALLRDRYGLVIHRSRQRLEAQPASQLDMQLLGVRAGAPVFVLESLNDDGDGRPLWMDVDRVRADRVLFEVTSSEDGMMRRSLAALTLASNED